MASLESISNQIESIPGRKENLRKSFQELRPYLSALSFSLQWKDIEDYIDSINKSINQSFCDLASRERGKQKKPAVESHPSANEKGETVPANKFQEPQVESHPSPNEKGETVPAHEFEEPQARALRNLIKKNVFSLSTIDEKVKGILQSSSNPAKLGLDVMDGLDDWHGYQVVLEALTSIAPEIKVPERTRAMKLAGTWKEKMGASICCKAQAVTFLTLVIAFGFVSDDFEADELLEVACEFAQKKQEIGLCQKFVGKCPDLIQKLIGKGRHVAAVNFVLAFELEDKFHPVHLLEAFLKETKQSAQEILQSGNNSTESKARATEKELSAMRGIMKCIDKNKLKAESLQESVQKDIAELEKQQADEKHTATFAVPDPHQQPVNKRPQPTATASAGLEKTKKLKSQPQIAPAAALPQITNIRPLARPAGTPFAQTVHITRPQPTAMSFPQTAHVRQPSLLPYTSFPHIANAGPLPQPAAASFFQTTFTPPPLPHAPPPYYQHGFVVPNAGYLASHHYQHSRPSVGTSGWSHFYPEVLSSGSYIRPTGHLFPNSLPPSYHPPYHP